MQSQKEVEEIRGEPPGPTQLGTDPDEWLIQSKEQSEATQKDLAWSSVMT